MFPGLSPIVGYAVTCREDTTSPRDEGRSSYEPVYEAVRAAPKPTILVCEDAGGNRLRSCHLGDIMAATLKSLGVVGVVTDGGVRDLAGVGRHAKGLQVFAAGAVAGAGTPYVLEVNVPVSIFGLPISPGDLLHGDADGLVSIPVSMANEVAVQAQAIKKRERAKLRSLTRRKRPSALKE